MKIMNFHSTKQHELIIWLITPPEKLFSCHFFLFAYHTIVKIYRFPLKEIFTSHFLSFEKENHTQKTKNERMKETGRERIWKILTHSTRSKVDNECLQGRSWKKKILSWRGLCGFSFSCCFACFLNRNKKEGKENEKEWKNVVYWQFESWQKRGPN